MPSKLKSLKSGTEVPGTNGRYIICSQLGVGGNGAVYSISDCNDAIHSNIYAIKVFVPSRNQNERFKRFKNEINTISNLSNEIDGLISIVDHHFSSKSVRGDFSWYMMPLAEPYQLTGSVEKKIRDMISLGKIIRELHRRGLEHRDIKPSNLLVLNGKVILADFGLCWNEDADNHITGSSEILGPASIRPPEFEMHRNPDGIDYKKSDVYLFAKTVWIVLTNNWKGFKGEYNRGDSRIYLDKDTIGVKTLEPIHKMMEMATKSDFNDRADIDDCLTLLQKQKAIVDESIDESELNEFISKEVLGIANALEPDVRVFFHPKSVAETLKRLSGYSFLIGIIDYERRIVLGRYSSVEELTDHNDYRIRVFDMISDYKTIIIHINELSLDKKSVVIKTGQCSQSGGDVKICTSVKELMDPDYKLFILNGGFTIEFGI